MAKKPKGVQYYEGIGRRKTAVARVRLYLATKEKVEVSGGTQIAKGEIYIDASPIDKVYPNAADQALYQKPLALTENADRFAISIHVAGGGKAGQLVAITHGMSRALEKIDRDAYRPILKKEGLLTRDARERQRRRVGTGGKARRQKQSPKR